IRLMVSSTASTGLLGSLQQQFDPFFGVKATQKQKRWHVGRQERKLAPREIRPGEFSFTWHLDHQRQHGRLSPPVPFTCLPSLALRRAVHAIGSLEQPPRRESPVEPLLERLLRHAPV